MIYSTISIQHIYRRLELVCNFADDNELANIYEFIGWCVRDIGVYIELEKVSKLVTVEDHRAAWPCDFFTLNQVCFNGWPLTYTGQTFKYQYLLCDECFNANSVITQNAVIRGNNTLSAITADYVSTDGVQTVAINQIVKVDASHEAGGELGHYYKRTTSDIISQDLSTIDYTGVNWEDVSTDTNEYNTGSLLSYYGSPYEYSYHINPGYIITSFEDGDIEVSYNRIPTDDDGFYKIPDNENYLTAVEYYCKMRLAQRGYKFPEEPLNVLKAEYIRFKMKAISDAMWFNIDSMDAFTKRWMRPLAVLDRAQNFFKPEL